MRRREALALLAVVLLILGGRALRARLLLGPDGAWRDPQWLADRLPEPPSSPVTTAAAPSLTPMAADSARADSATAAAATGPTARRPRPPVPALAGPVDPNTCPRDSLLLLPGIGPALADRILAARAGGVRFATLADLRVVKGIGPKVAARLAPWLQFPPSRQSAHPEPPPGTPPAARVP